MPVSFVWGTGRFLPQSMARFAEFINDNELIDLPLVGRRFTWSKNADDDVAQLVVVCIAK